jgi:SAM-dependent methyltransferase
MHPIRIGGETQPKACQVGSKRFVRDQERWQPSKFVKDRRSGRYVPNPKYVGVGSRYVCRLIIDEYVRLIRTHANGVLLDCGCGDVPYYDVYRSKVSDVVCIDWKRPQREIDHVDIYVDLNGRLPFDDATFDTVLLTDVLEHIIRPTSLMGELSRVLRPAGVLVCTTPFLYFLHEEPHDYYRYTEFALRALCNENNLAVIELEPYGGYPDVLLDLLNKKLVAGETAARAYLAVCRLVTRSGVYRRVKERSKSSFPLGYCLAAQKV